MRRAIISVSDKTGIVDFAKGLVGKGYEIISTGGTAAALQKAGVKTIDVESVTGFPECLDGRVKTLHPKIHGGVLAIREKESHMQTLKELNVATIDLVCVNLYPFKNTIAKKDHTLSQAIENIDIGGPSLLRAAGKNYKYVTVVTDPEDYSLVLETMDNMGGVSPELNFKLAAKAFSHTAAYDALISTYLNDIVGEEFPKEVTYTFEKKQALRYGENPHQKAAYYVEPLTGGNTIADATCLHGKELSFNNMNDADSAIAIVKEFNEPACVGLKHTNPCGVAVGEDSFDSYKKAYEADPVSIFGGIVAFNCEVNKECACEINKIFVEIVIAPSYTKEALEVLMSKKNIRVLLLPGLVNTQEDSLQFKKISGGLLLQEEDLVCEHTDNYKTMTKKEPTQQEKSDMAFAMKVCKHVKSNAIVIAKDGKTLGIGGGSVNRIWAAENALARAGKEAEGAVVASDAFFPFDDCVRAFSKGGITAIAQPGGSKNDQQSVDACNELGLAMVATGVRHFKH